MQRLESSGFQKPTGLCSKRRIAIHHCAVQRLDQLRFLPRFCFIVIVHSEMRPEE